MTTPAPTRSPFPALAPVAIMCLVAAVQVYLATAHHLSPWKGGGFGMFASTDDPGSRFIECVGQTTDGQDVVIRGAFSAFAPGASLTSSSARLIQTFPTKSALAAAAPAPRLLPSPATAAPPWASATASAPPTAPSPTHHLHMQDPLV